jgi:hypothetical protein
VDDLDVLPEAAVVSQHPADALAVVPRHGVDVDVDPAPSGMTFT